MRVLLVLMLFLFGCSSTPQNAASSNEESSGIIEEAIFFKQKDLKDLDKSTLQTVDAETKNSLVDCLSWSSDSFDAYIYKPIKGGGLVVYINSIRGTALYYVNQSCLRLTQDECDLMEQNDHYETIWCDLSEAVFRDDGLTLIIQHKEILDYGDKSETKRDSLTHQFKINQQGFNLVQKDSLRLDY